MDASCVVSSDQICGLIQRTLNHVDGRLVDHGVRVAYLMKQMLLADGSYSDQQIQDICLIAMLHDIGAYKTDEIDEMVSFESENIWQHSIYGYLFLKYLSPLSEYAEIILYHHMPAMDIEYYHTKFAMLAQMLFLVDRIDVFVLTGNRTQEDLMGYLEHTKGKVFFPAVTELFLKVMERQTKTVHLEEVTYAEVFPSIQLSHKQVDAYLKMLTYAIDFRSQYTVTHTITTTQIAFSLAKRMKVQEPLLTKVYYGAILNDLGKIAIPVEILEFPGKLSSQAMNIMRQHVAYTEEILDHAIDEETIAIAIRHHEKLDGSGYLRGLKGDELTQTQRIVAVADIASALLGERSYKESYSKDKTLEVIKELKHDGKIDSDVVDVLVQHFDEILQDVNRHCQPLLDVYEGIHNQYDALLERLDLTGRT